MNKPRHIIDAYARIEKALDGIHAARDEMLYLADVYDISFSEVVIFTPRISDALFRQKQALLQELENETNSKNTKGKKN